MLSQEPSSNQLASCPPGGRLQLSLFLCPSCPELTSFLLPHQLSKCLEGSKASDPAGTQPTSAAQLLPAAASELPLRAIASKQLAPKGPPEHVAGTCGAGLPLASGSVWQWSLRASVPAVSSAGAHAHGAAAPQQPACAGQPVPAGSDAQLPAASMPTGSHSGTETFCVKCCNTFKIIDLQCKAPNGM